MQETGQVVIVISVLSDTGVLDSWCTAHARLLHTSPRQVTQNVSLNAGPANKVDTYYFQHCLQYNAYTYSKNNQCGQNMSNSLIIISYSDQNTICKMFSFLYKNSNVREKMDRAC